MYKLTEYKGIPRIKISEEKLTYPAKKQIYRIFDKNGRFKEDILMLDDEIPPPNSEALLFPVLKKGKLVSNLPELNEIQQVYLNNINKLPEDFKVLEENHIFTLRISKKLEDLINSLKNKFV